MIKILFLIPTLGGGGAERVLCNLVNNLDQTKYDVTVQTLFDTGINRNLLKSHVHFIPGKFHKQFRGNVMYFKLFSPSQLYKKTITGNYDIVVSYLEGSATRIVSGCHLEHVRKVAWVHVEQSSVLHAAYGYRSLREYQDCYNKFDIVACVAESVKKDFLSLTDYEGECLVCYNTNEDARIKANSDETVNWPGENGVTRIVSVGRLVPEKGYDRLIKVHKRLIDNGFKHEIFILGTGNEKHFQTLIKENGVSDTFYLLGFQENPYKYVAKSDLFVCSSRREGFSTAVTEALILGVPVVSTCCSGAYELLGENDEYGIVTENSEKGIYEGLHRMLSEDELLSHYKKMAIERGQHFSKELTVKAVERMFERITEESKTNV